MCGVFDPKRHRIGRWPTLFTKLCRLAHRFHIEDEVDIALLKADHILGTVLRYRRKAQLAEVGGQGIRVRTGEFNKLKAISAKWVFKQIRHRVLQPRKPDYSFICY